MDAFLEIFLGKGEEEMLTLYVTQQTAQNTIFFSPQFTPFGNYHPLCVCFSFFLLILWSPHTCAHTHTHSPTSSSSWVSLSLLFFAVLQPFPFSSLVSLGFSHLYHYQPSRSQKNKDHP